MSQDDLMKALHFTAADLEINRKGQLSDEQRLKLGTQGSTKTMAYSLLALALAALAALPGLRIVRAGPSFREPSDVVLMVVFACLALVPASLAFMRWRKVMADTVSGTVQIARGIVSTDVRQISRGNVLFIVNLKNLEFHVSKAAMQSFTNSAPYAVYYAPNTMTMLSAEPIPVR